MCWNTYLPTCRGKKDTQIKWKEIIQQWIFFGENSGNLSIKWRLRKSCEMVQRFNNIKVESETEKKREKCKRKISWTPEFVHVSILLTLNKALSKNTFTTVSQHWATSSTKFSFFVWILHAMEKGKIDSNLPSKHSTNLHKYLDRKIIAKMCGCGETKRKK